MIDSTEKESFGLVFGIFGVSTSGVGRIMFGTGLIRGGNQRGGGGTRGNSVRGSIWAG